jgi:hypothetical protein
VDSVVNITLGLIVFACLGFGLVLIAINYVYIFLNWRNQRRGYTKHYSLIFVAGPITMTTGWLLVTMIPGTLSWVLLATWTADPATWVLAFSLLGARRATRNRAG